MSPPIRPRALEALEALRAVALDPPSLPPPIQPSPMPYRPGRHHRKLLFQNRVYRAMGVTMGCVVAVSLTWSRTFPDNPDRTHDFVAHENGVSVGRIYRVEMAEGRAWLWAAHGVTASAGTVGCTLSGHEPTKQEAADRVKAAWGLWVGIRTPATGDP